MCDSTVFRDLGQYLEREATRLREMGSAEWAGHLLEDSDRLLEHAKALAESEPPLPSIESLAGIDLGFRSAEAESELERLRRREAALSDSLRYMLWCSESRVWPTKHIDEVRAVLEQGGQS